MTDARRYTATEMLAILSARHLKDGQVVFAGIGTPLLAATLAQQLNCPALTILFEGGVVGAFVEPGKLPPSTNDQRCAKRSNMVLGSADVLLLMQRGYVDVGFMGGAQIDQYGNLNSSFIGDPSAPTIRRFAPCRPDSSPAFRTMRRPPNGVVRPRHASTPGTCCACAGRSGSSRVPWEPSTSPGSRNCGPTRSSIHRPHLPTSPSRGARSNRSSAVGTRRVAARRSVRSCWEGSRARPVARSVRHSAMTIRTSSGACSPAR